MVKKDTFKLALTKSTTRINNITRVSVKQAIEDYPYLAVADLVSSDKLNNEFVGKNRSIMSYFTIILFHI